VAKGLEYIGLLAKFLGTEIAWKFDLNGVDGTTILASVGLNVVSSLEIIFFAGRGVHLR
jgi:hypothetical protein